MQLPNSTCNARSPVDRLGIVLLFSSTFSDRSVLLRMFSRRVNMLTSTIHLLTRLTICISSLRATADPFSPSKDRASKGHLPSGTGVYKGGTGKTAFALSAFAYADSDARRTTPLRLKVTKIAVFGLNAQNLRVAFWNRKCIPQFVIQSTTA
jgi:hypothetical protein